MLKAGNWTCMSIVDGDDSPFSPLRWQVLGTPICLTLRHFSDAVTCAMSYCPPAMVFVEFSEPHDWMLMGHCCHGTATLGALVYHTVMVRTAADMGNLFAIMKKA